MKRPTSTLTIFGSMNNPTTIALRPREVSYAGFLLIGSFLLGLVQVPFEVIGDVSQEQYGFAIFLGLLVAVFGALTLLLVAKINQRKNWARWVVGVVVLLSFASTLNSLEEQWKESSVGTVLNCLTGLMELVAVWVLFARRSNDWFANQSETNCPANSPEQVSEGRSGVTSMGYLCPCCGLRIAFLSKVIQATRKHQICPYCNKKIKRDVAYGKFFLLMLVVGLPIKLLGKTVPALSFFGSSITTALVTGFLIMLCMSFKEDQA